LTPLSREPREASEKLISLAMERGRFG